MMKPLFLLLFFSAALSAQTRYYVNPMAFSGQTALSVAHLPAGAYVWVLEGAGVRVQGRCLAGGF